MADNLRDACGDAVTLAGLAEGLELMMNEGERMAEAASALAPVVLEKARQLANDLDRIERGVAA